MRCITAGENSGCSAEWLVASSCMLVQRDQSFFASERAQNLRKEGWSIPSHYLRRQILRHFENCRKLLQSNCQKLKIEVSLKVKGWFEIICVDSRCQSCCITWRVDYDWPWMRLHVRMRTNCMPECLTMWRKILRNFPKIYHEPAYTRRGISLTTSKALIDAHLLLAAIRNVETKRLKKGRRAKHILASFDNNLKGPTEKRQRKNDRIGFR